MICWVLFLILDLHGFGEYDFYDYGNQILLTANEVSFQVACEIYAQKANNIRAPILITIRAGISVNYDL